LGPAAVVVFANLVVDLVERSAVGAAVKGYISPNAALVKHINAGRLFI